MKEFDSLCQRRMDECHRYAHAHCASCNGIVTVEPCCSDPNCHGYGYADGAACKTCTDCILCDDCRKNAGICPHCIAYESAVSEREYAHG